MSIEHIRRSIGRKIAECPAARIGERTVTVTGRFVRAATILDEEWHEYGVVDNPDEWVAAVKASGLKADILSFQLVEANRRPFCAHRMEWDNIAVVPISTFDDWWMNRVPQVVRKNVRRAERRGVTVRVAAFDDEMVRGIKSIYDETPLRQGRPFWHYGKDLETVRRDNASFADRSDFIGAYFENTLIGFLKLVYVGRTARIMQILSMNAHEDKRPTNALLAKGVELCCEKGMEAFVYSKLIYDNMADSPMTEFKRRNGFEQILIPRCYCPLSLKGRVLLLLRLHLGWKRLIACALLRRLLLWRAIVYQRWLRVPRAETVGE